MAHGPVQIFACSILELRLKSSEKQPCTLAHNGGPQSERQFPYQLPDPLLRFALLRGPLARTVIQAPIGRILLVVWTLLLPPACSPPAVPDRHVRSSPGHSHRRCLGRLLGGWVGIEKCPALHSPCVVARHGKSTADPKHKIHRFTDPEQISSTRTLPLRILANLPLITGV